MSSTNIKADNLDKRKPSPLADLLFGIVIPSIILLKFSSPESLGATYALILAISFPIVWGLFHFIYHKSFNFIAALGLVSVALTGGIGLFQLDTHWLAVKEAAIPALIGAAVLVSTFTRSPLVNWLIYNPSIMNVEKIKQRLSQKEMEKDFDGTLLKATYWLSGTFMFSALMNYILAKWLVTSPAGTEAFNEELAKMTMLSYPVIAIPSTLAMIGIVYYLWKSIHSITGLEFEEILATPAKSE